MSDTVFTLLLTGLHGLLFLLIGIQYLRHGDRAFEQVYRKRPELLPLARRITRIFASLFIIGGSSALVWAAVRCMFK